MSAALAAAPPVSRFLIEADIRSAGGNTARKEVFWVEDQDNRDTPSTQHGAKVFSKSISIALAAAPPDSGWVLLETKIRGIGEDAPRKKMF